MPRLGYQANVYGVTFISNDEDVLRHDISFYERDILPYDRPLEEYTVISNFPPRKKRASRSKAAIAARLRSGGNHAETLPIQP